MTPAEAWTRRRHQLHRDPTYVTYSAFLTFVFALLVGFFLGLLVGGFRVYFS